MKLILNDGKGTIFRDSRAAIIPLESNGISHRKRKVTQANGFMTQFCNKIDFYDNDRPHLFWISRWNVNAFIAAIDCSPSSARQKNHETF